MKLKNEIQELRAEWMDRKFELEEKLNEKMEQCRQLGNSLITATEDVKQKSRELLEKEKTLEATKAEIEGRYMKLLTGNLVAVSFRYFINPVTAKFNSQSIKVKNHTFISLTFLNII